MNRAYIPKAKSDIHITPDRIWDIIQKKWGFKKNMFFDPCPINHTKDGLGIRWKKLNFVNPPYTLLREFVYYGIKEARFGKTSVFLLPSKTDQEWFHTLIQYDYEIIWIRKRLKFKNNKHASGQSHFLVMIDEQRKVKIPRKIIGISGYI